MGRVDRTPAQSAALVLLIVLLSAPLPAAPPDALTQDEAVALVRERVPGRVLRVERLVRDERVQYKVRVLTRDGRVREYVVDAATGRMR